MESIRSFEISSTRPEFDFSYEETEIRNTLPNPEAYPGCLVQAMRAANTGVTGASGAVESTIRAARGSDLAMVCGRCGIAMIRDDGVVYGATRCPLVQSGEQTLGELA